MKQKIIKALKNRLTWVVITGLLGLAGVNLPPEVVNTIGPAIVSIVEGAK